MNTYLNLPHIRQELGIDPAFGNYSWVSSPVSLAFYASGDELHANQLYISELLARDVKVLIYAGTLDFICNWVGNEKWTLEMEWFGQKDYTSQALRDWTIDGKVVGQTRSAHGLTFATVFDGGHALPHDTVDLWSH